MTPGPELTPDLTTDDGLRAAAVAVMRPESWGTDESRWTKALANVLDWIGQADVRERSEKPFQERLWEDNHVAAVGQGNISVESALDDVGFRNWLAD